LLGALFGGARRSPLIVLTAAIWLLSLGTAAVRADLVATYRLGPASVTGTVADFAVSLEYTATAGEELVFFSIDVSLSDLRLSPGDTDYSAFSFTPASPLLDDWLQIGNFNDPGFDTVEYQTTALPLTPGVLHPLGQLHVDYGGSGIAAGERFTVAITGPESVVGYDLPSSPSFEFKPVQNLDRGTQVVQASGDDGSSDIPEPGSLSLFLVLAAVLAASVLWRRRTRSSPQPTNP
jgi:hypothetical protein